MAADRLFLDTSLLVAASIPAHPGHAGARAYLRRTRRASWCISPQICREFLVVVTRQPVEDLVYTLGEATAALMEWRATCDVLSEGTDTIQMWLDLAREHKVVGKSLHDCNIVAVMLTHNVNRIGTRNPADFKRYGIRVDAVKP
ncbi:MAG TPA: PIN domain-containing protein [Candidatus Nanopelagicales bacterium]|nr:PIN domain-containing protein [Candidatus Nanopelagicales bacterium]